MCLYLIYITFTLTSVYLVLALEASGDQINRIIGHLKAISLAVLAALATLAALVDLVFDVLGIPRASAAGA